MRHFMCADNMTLSFRVIGSPGITKEEEHTMSKKYWTNIWLILIGFMHIVIIFSSHLDH